MYRAADILFDVALRLFWGFSYAALICLIVTSPIILFVSPFFFPAAVFIAIGVPLSIFALGVVSSGLCMLAAGLAAGMGEFINYVSPPQRTVSVGKPFVDVPATQPAYPYQHPQQHLRGTTMFARVPATPHSAQSSFGNTLNNP